MDLNEFAPHGTDAFGVLRSGLLDRLDPQRRLAVYTDGSYIQSHGVGSWCVYLADDLWAAGAFATRSSAETEYRAIQVALEVVPVEQPIEIRSDHRSIVTMLRERVPELAANGWCRSTDKGRPLAHQQLVQDLAGRLSGRDVTLRWVRGHGRYHGNRAADQRARAAARATVAGRRVWDGPAGVSVPDNFTSPPLRLLNLTPVAGLEPALV